MNFIPVNTPLLDGNEGKYLMEAIDTNWISSEGPFITKFEEAFAKKVGRKYGVSVSNGTAALEVAVKTLGLGPGDEVIMPSFTIISCASALVKVGAIPVLVDSEPDSWNMDISQVNDKITPSTKAIMVVHIYGLAIDMKSIINIAQEHDLAIIEDAAEAIGQESSGYPCGSFGDVSIFSFYPNKLITTGEGGMVVTNSEKIYEHAKSLRNLCFKREKRFVHDELGWNYRMTNLQAALGIAQLETLSKHVARKKEIGLRYHRQLSGLAKYIQLPLLRNEYSENIFWVFGIVLKEEAGYDATEFMEVLANQNIGTRPFFWPMHEQPIFQQTGMFANEKYPVSELIARYGLYLPSGLGIRNEEIDYVCGVLHATFNKQ
jgi:perosamine synthetase